MTREPIKKFINVSDWEPEPEDIIINQINDYVLIPVSKYFNADQTMDYFSVRSKKVYNKIKVRALIVHKLNYFEKFYDTDRELLTVYANIKYLIDCEPNYSKDALFYDLKRYIINGPSISLKMDYMNKDNYRPAKIKFSGTDRLLYYDNTHIAIMMRISLTMTLIIPLLTHFANKRKVQIIDEFLLEIYSYIIKEYEDFVDLFEKFTATCSTNIAKNKRNNAIWNNQDIRAINQSTHAIYSVNNIILNLMPKYIYNDSPVTLNYASIGQVIKYKVTDAGYDFAYTSLSSSDRDLDENSSLDKYEAILVKSDESLFIQNKVNGATTMSRIRMYFGPFDQNEIEFYRKRLLLDDKSVIHALQKELIFNMFYKYFGDTSSSNTITEDDYIVLLLTAKKICLQSDLLVLPCVFSSKIIKYTKKTKLNKKEKDRMIASPIYKMIMEKYNNNKKVEAQIEEWAATILSCEFEIIDSNRESNSTDYVVLPKFPDYVVNEVLKFASWVS